MSRPAIRRVTSWSFKDGVGKGGVEEGGEEDVAFGVWVVVVVDSLEVASCCIPVSMY